MSYICGSEREKKPPQYDHILIPETCDCVTLHGKEPSHLVGDFGGALGILQVIPE